MHDMLQPGIHSPQHPRRLRWIAVLGILLIAMMSTVQACHWHELTQHPSSSHQSQSDLSTDHCPLCSVMHSAMPATLQSAPEPVLLIQALDSAAADAERIFRWRFQLASRPPPADARRS